MFKQYETVLELIKEEIYSALFYEIDYYFNDGEKTLKKEKIQVDKSKNIKFGDFSSSIILSLGLDKAQALDLANRVANTLNKKKCFSKVEVAPPGFLNFFLSNETIDKEINRILAEKDKYGQFKPKKLFYNIEFVSANPTGLLHIGHARNAAIGDSLARIWTANGISVNREYYINDGGNQIEKLGLSVLIRYKQLCNIKDELPEDAYHASEIIDIAKLIKEKYGDAYTSLKHDNEKITDEPQHANFFKSFSKNYLLNIIKDTLKKFNVNMDIWFSESKIYENKLIDQTLQILKKYTFTNENALWLKTTDFGDDKDRVLVKSDGSYTYFLPDIAYHSIKLSRGYDKIFNIWGSDHASYANRMKIAVQMLGYKKEQLEILIMQMIRLVKDKMEFKMSKRTGNSLTLEDLLEVIGKDAARWYLVSQSLSTHLEVDVDQAKSPNENNPLYYVQYAHARCNQVLNKALYKLTNKFDLLTSTVEMELINHLLYFKHTIESISQSYEINKMTLYLTNLAKLFHSFYNTNKIIDETNKELSAQRYTLTKAVKYVIYCGLNLLGITAIEKM